MDAAGDSERNDAASASSPIPANPHHTTSDRQMSGSKKSVVAHAFDYDPDRNEFTIAREYLPPEKFDSSTAKPLKPRSHNMIMTAASALSITSSCHVEPSLDEHSAPTWSVDDLLRDPWDDPEATRAPDVDSVPPQKPDSSSAESALPEFFLQGLKCSVCDHAFGKTRSGWFHCNQCSNGTFVLCRSCYTNDEWCLEHTHTLDQWVFPVEEGAKVDMPDECIPDFFFRVETSIRRFRSAHTLPTCTTYSLLSPEDSILLDEERLQYKGSVTSAVVDTMPFPISDYLFGPARTTVQLTRGLRDLGIPGFTEFQMDILERFENPDNLDNLVMSPVNGGKSTAVLLGLIMQASIRNVIAAIACRSPGDFPEAQERSCRAPFAIIVCPTHDLAIEIFRRAWHLCYNTNVKPVLSVGGSDNLTVGDILIGTIAKLARIVKDRMTGPAQHVVIEQASHMLQDSAHSTLRRLFHESGAVDYSTKVWSLFSHENLFRRTMDNYGKLVEPFSGHLLSSRRFMEDSFDTDLVNDKNVHQHFFKVENRYEDLASRLTKALYRNDEARVVVFTNTAEDCDILGDLLSRRIDDGFRKVRARGSNMAPRQREANVESLRRGKCQVLITTGSLALGVKIVSLTHIINFSLPRDEKDEEDKLFIEYLQRIGMGGLSDNRITSWAYYDEKDEELFSPLAVFLLEAGQVGSVQETLAKFKYGETIMPH